MTLFVRIAILNLVFCTILSNKRLPDYVSNDCDNVLSDELCNIMGFFFIWIFTIRAQRCKEDYLSYFVAFFSIRNQFALQDRLNAPRTTSVKDVVFPVLRNRRVSHQLRHYRKNHQGVLELLEGTSRNCCDPHSIQLLSCCFLLE